jgi:hypothetical protein
LTKTYASVAVLAQKTALLALFPKTTVFTKSTLIHASTAARAKAHAPLALPNRRNFKAKKQPYPGLFFSFHKKVDFVGYKTQDNRAFLHKENFF